MKKTFLVTGASRGIGFDLVKYIAAQGHKVFALSRNTNSLEASEMIFPFNIDITDEIALEKFTNELKQDEVIIDVLINNKIKPVITLKEQFDLMSVCFASDKSLKLKKKIKIKYL